MLALRGLQDAGLRKVEHTLRDNLKSDYDIKIIDKVSTLSSYFEFGLWYLLVAVILYYMPISWTSKIVTFSAIAFLQLLCGNEDFWHYFFEPLFPHPKREIRYPVKIWIWRFPKTLHWLGAGDNEGHSGWHNPLLMFFCGKEVRLKPFLWVVLISTLLVYLLSIYWK
jgi:hypothetical protein